ncbi:SPRY domain-containing protein [Paenibacillus sp. LK1]|uniref:SPRY domain-containing protein n=1 Tax=Paenibacillus sp. LK1 TaxID=2053014 RepID=UPI000C180B8B|nr:SPRY domain-containing protein [Paenibacillus sp. LK1]PIH59772.1 hypothetical protein CS562_07485 [Paenibacillus sp. LK1]
MDILNVTLDPNNKYGTHTLDSNLLGAKSVTDSSRITTTLGKSSGKWYWEYTHTTTNDYRIHIGIVSETLFPIYNSLPVNSSYTRTYFGYNGNKYPENTPYGTRLKESGGSVVIGVAMDLDNGTLEFYKNGVSMGVSHTDILNLGKVFPFFASVGTASSGPISFTVNFGSRDFKYPVPAGFSPYNISYENKILLSSGGKNYRLEKTVSRENAVPVMTSALNANVEITASAFNASDYPWYAFDGIVNATVRPFWYTLSTPPTGGHWLQVKFIKPKVITGISLASLLVTGDKHSIKDFELYGSNDGVMYEKLYTNTQPNVGTRIYYDFESNKAYSYYRLNILSSYNLTTTVGVNEMEIFQKKNQTMYVIDTSDENDIIQYGMKGDISFNGVVDKVKDVIKMNLPLGSSKTFEHTIDMSKRRVDKITLG